MEAKKKVMRFCFNVFAACSFQKTEEDKQTEKGSCRSLMRLSKRIKEGGRNYFRAVGKVEGKPSPLQEETFLAGWGVTEASCKLPAGSGAGIGLAVTVGRTT